MDNADAYLHVRFGRVSSTSFAHRREKNECSLKLRLDMVHLAFPYGPLVSVPHQGIEPRLAGSKPTVLSITLAGHGFSSPTWTRTRTRTFRGSDACHYTIGTQAEGGGIEPYPTLDRATG